MPRSLDLQIRDHVAEYVGNEVSLEQFLDWFMDAAEDAYETDNGRLIDLVDTIKLYWAEHTNGDLTEDALRAALRRVAETYLFATESATWQHFPSIQTSATGQPPILKTMALSVSSGPQPTTGATYTTTTETESDRQTLGVVNEPERNTSQEFILQ
jgi:hypothetical protein